MALLRRQNRKYLILVLLLVSVGLLLLPERWNARLKAPVQLLQPLQEAASRVLESTRRRFGQRSPSVAMDENELAALRHEVASQEARIDALERDNKILSRFHRQSGDAGRLIPTRVLSRDALAWRGSFLVSAGTNRGVRGGQGVASSFFVDVGAVDRIRSGMSVLTGEALVGFVDTVETFASRVRLLSDLESALPVTLARYEGDQVRILGLRFWMTGSETGAIYLRDVDHSFIDDGRIRTGDTVMTLDDDARLPAALVIGTVADRALQRDNNLLYDLTVTLAVSPDVLHRVYIVDAE